MFTIIHSVSACRAAFDLSVEDLKGDANFHFSKDKKGRRVDTRDSFTFLGTRADESQDGERVVMLVLEAKNKRSRSPTTSRKSRKSRKDLR